MLGCRSRRLRNRKDPIEGVPAMLGFDNPIHLIFVLVLLLLVFGAKRMPEMGRSLGSGMRGFKESLSGNPSQSAGPEQVTRTDVSESPVLATDSESRVSR
jgi:sec-independent protein translocase protein TatA